MWFRTPDFCDGSRMVYGVSYQANKIANNLYQGGFPPPGDGLKQAGIDVLVLCAMEWQDDTAYPGLIVIKAPTDDDPRPGRTERFVPIWKAAAQEAAAHLQAGKVVLVTCMQGWNRSGMVSAMIVSMGTNLKGKAIVEHIQQCRPGALCNPSFVKYIEENL